MLVDVTTYDWSIRLHHIFSITHNLTNLFNPHKAVLILHRIMLTMFPNNLVLMILNLFHHHNNWATFGHIYKQNLGLKQVKVTVGCFVFSHPEIDIQGLSKFTRFLWRSHHLRLYHLSRLESGTHYKVLFYHLYMLGLLNLPRLLLTVTSPTLSILLDLRALLFSPPCILRVRLAFPLFVCNDAIIHHSKHFLCFLTFEKSLIQENFVEMVLCLFKVLLILVWHLWLWGINWCKAVVGASFKINHSIDRR